MPVIPKSIRRARLDVERVEAFLEDLAGSVDVASDAAHPDLAEEIDVPYWILVKVCAAAERVADATTDLSSSPAAVPARYAARWATEDTFRATKQILRGESPQVRKRHAAERAAAFCFWLYSAVWTWYLTTVGTARSWIPTPWYPAKTTPGDDAHQLLHC